MLIIQQLIDLHVIRIIRWIGAYCYDNVNQAWPFNKNVYGAKFLFEVCCIHSCHMMTSSNGIFFPRYWPFVWGIHRSPVNSPHKGQWLGALMFSLICVWINGWVNIREAGDLRRNQAHHDVILMILFLERVIHTWHGMCTHVTFQIHVRGSRPNM